MAAARHAAAQLRGRGRHPASRDLLDPGADRVIRELAATGSELVDPPHPRPDELDPPIEGDLRLVDAETRRRHGRHASTSRPSTPTRLASRPGRQAWRTSRPDARATYVPLTSDVPLADLSSPSSAGAGCRVRPTMPFLAPLALLGLAFIPLVVAFYLLKLRRDERVVPSTLLWQRLLSDVEANAPWQRLRRSLLLLLQLLLVLLLALLAARPFLERPAGFARRPGHRHRHLGEHGRHRRRPEPARGRQGRRASTRCATCPAGGHVSVIAAGRSARVVANATSDLGHVRSAIESITARTAPGDMADALRLASALAARAGDAEVLVATDGAISPTSRRSGLGPGPGPSRWAPAPATRRSSRSRSGPHRRP